MSDNITAEIVAIGTEILLGEILDTNSVFLAKAMRDLGINIYFMTSVGDNVGRIVSALRVAMGRADIVITCGGLGPTIDDMTRQSIAEATDRRLIFEQTLLDQITVRFAGFRMAMPENNRRQAYIPEGALILENPVGTAPSFITEHGQNVIITLPGVPREMKFLMNERVIPYLQTKYALGLILARNLRVAGIGESALDERIGTDLLEATNPSIGLAAHNSIIDIRLTAKADTRAVAESMLDLMETQVRGRVGEYVFGYDKDTIEQVVINQLTHDGRHLSVIEAGLTTGIIAQIEKLPEIAGTLQSYATPLDMTAALGLPSETPYREIVKAMLHTLKTEEHYALVIVSDPEVEEGADTQESTIVGILAGDEMIVRAYGFGARSELARGWVSRWGLANIWRLARGITS